MSNLNNRPFSIKLKQGLAANINTTATKNLAHVGELHYATDTKQLYIFDGTENIPVGGAIWGGITGTLSDQTDLQTALDAAKEEEMFAQQVDFINDDLLYRGEADPGTATATALWRIRKITIDNAGEGDVITTWAGGTAAFDKIWDDRLGLIYT